MWRRTAFALTLSSAFLSIPAARGDDSLADAPLPPETSAAARASDRDDAVRLTAGGGISESVLRQTAPMAPSGPVYAGDQGFSNQFQRPQVVFPGMNVMMQPPAGDQPEEPVFTQAETASTPTSTFGGFVDLGSLSTARQAEAESVASSDVVLGSEAEVRNTTDSNDLLSNSMSTTGIYLHSRNPVSNDIRIRGFRFGQIRGHVNGAYWRPVRQDFDTPLSKIDSSIIRDVIVTKGPYNVRQGAGFAFIDIELQETPRYDCYQWTGRTAAIFDTNGDQHNVRQTVAGGGSNYGYRIGYGDRGGVDYFAGDDTTRVASGFKSRDWEMAYGFDLGCDRRIEFNYQRIDQNDIELPSQYFDVDYLTADSFSIRYFEDYTRYYDHLRVDAWWNRTEFSGNADNQTKEGIRINPDLAVLAGDGSIGDVRSTGIRAATTWGDPGCPQLTTGLDYSFVDEEFIETSPSYIGFFGLPRGVTNNPGAFADFSAPLNACTTVKVGGRIDDYNIDSVNGGTVSPANDEQNFTLRSGFISLERELDCNWTGTLSYGYAERAPTPTDLYIASFMELLQVGGAIDFRGNTALNKERLNQIDLGLTFEYPLARGGVHVFANQIDDYISYSGTGGGGTGGSFLVNTINVDARMAGGEFYGEVDLTCDWVGFGSISYVQATDRTNDIPLFGIPPLESRIGVRYVQEFWGAEFVARVADDQDRIDTFLAEQATPGFATFDVRAYAQLTRGLRLVAGVENLGDRFYQEHLDSYTELTRGTPGGVFRPGTNGYVGLIATY